MSGRFLEDSGSPFLLVALCCEGWWIVAVVELDGVPSSPGEAIAWLHAAYDVLDDFALSGVDVAELGEFTVEVLRGGERQRALQAKTVAACEQAGVAPRQGSVASTTAYLASQTHGPTAAIAPARTNGLWLLDFPVLADAWADGELTEDHVRELRKVDNPRIHLLLVRDQQLHVDAAHTLHWSEWLNHLAYWLLHADPDGALEHESTTRYGLTFRTDRHGDIDVKGKLDPLTGEALLTMVEHEAEKLFRAEQQAKLPPIDQSTTRERNLLALMRLCKRGFQREDGGWPAPLINIVMSEQVGEDLVSRMLDGDSHDPFELPVDYFDVDKRCETIRGTPLDPRRAWPVLVTGWLRRQVMNAKNRRTNLGHDVRLFNTVQKQALLVEARGHCTTTGCDAPFSWLQADHIHPAGKHGPTNLDNGQIKCQPCNHRKSDHIIEDC